MLNSLTVRQLLLSGASVVLIIGLVGGQLFLFNQLSEVNSYRDSVIHFTADWSEIRRLEKDYLAYSDDTYIGQIDERGDRLSAALQALPSLFDGDEQVVSELLKIETQLKDYEKSLAGLVMLKRRIGYDEVSGEYGRFREAIHSLEDRFADLGNDPLTILLLQLRRAEKDFMLRKRTEYLERHQALHDELLAQIQAMTLDSTDESDLTALLSTYQVSFTTLSDSLIEQGLNRDEGIRGRIRAISDGIERKLDDVYDIVIDTVSRREQQLTNISIWIVVIAVPLFVSIATFSYRGLKGSLKTFAQFFQQSKHGHSIIDIGSIQYKEFRDLATVANEMVEIRSSVEQQLRDAQAELAESVQQLKSLNVELEQMATVDALTNIPNRRALMTAITRECARGEREQQPLAVVLIDVDHFKPFNDNYGHPRGDDVLRKVATALKDSVRRPTDLVARYGGEEFAALLANTDIEGAKHVAESMLAAVEALQIRHEYSSTSDFVTASAGVYAGIPHRGTLSEELIKKADDALYAAKGAGRNRVAVQPQLPPDAWR